MEEKSTFRENLTGILIIFFCLAIIIYAIVTKEFFVLGIPSIIYGVYALISGKIWVWKSFIKIFEPLIELNNLMYPKTETYRTRFQALIKKLPRVFGIFSILAGIIIIVVTKLLVVMNIFA